MLYIFHVVCKALVNCTRDCTIKFWYYSTRLWLLTHGLLMRVVTWVN